MPHPYFIAAHPGTTDEDMMHLALWLKQHRFFDKVQTFIPRPWPPLRRCITWNEPPAAGETRQPVTEHREKAVSDDYKGLSALPDPDSWPLLRKALKQMGRRDLLGSRASGPHDNQTPPGGEAARRQLSHPAPGEHRGKGRRR